MKKILASTKSQLNAIIVLLLFFKKVFYNYHGKSIFLLRAMKIFLLFVN